MSQSCLLSSTVYPASMTRKGERSAAHDLNPQPRAETLYFMKSACTSDSLTLIYAAVGHSQVQRIVFLHMFLNL